MTEFKSDIRDHEEIVEGIDGSKSASGTDAAEASNSAQSDIQRLSSKELGSKGELAACCYLEKRDYQILERNWTCEYGEADIIAMDEDTLVFVEVKTRSSQAKGLPEEAVTIKKRRRYEQIALAYLRQCDIMCAPIRFDVISITLIADDRAFLRHHSNAFGREL